MTPNRPRPRLPELAQREKQTLRIQAAAVVAQQAALNEEEAHLQQRRLTLDQQEAQLAAHLEEKRRRLMELRDQAREARRALAEQQAAFEKHTGQVNAELAVVRAEVDDSRRQTRLERERLFRLRRKLRQRWHRHWAAERAAMQRWQAEVAHRARQVEQAEADMSLDRAELRQAEMRFNGRVEVERRQLQAGWNLLREAQEQWQELHARESLSLQERSDRVERREAEAAEGQRDLEREKSRWERRRKSLDHEVEGLDSRIRNQRLKALDLQEELLRLENALRDAQPDVDIVPVDGKPSAMIELRPAVATNRSPGANAVRDQEAHSDNQAGPLAPSVWEQRAKQLANAEMQLQRRVAVLQSVADDLADQRFHLAEQFQKLAQIQKAWEADRKVSLADLETAGERLREREHAVATKEQALDTAGARHEQEHLEAAHLRHRLEAWETQLVARQAAWKAECEHLLAQLRDREETAERRTDTMENLRRRWHERRCEELGRLKNEYALCAKLRQECASLREEWLGRRAALEQKQRALVERALVMEQYWQEQFRQGGSPSEGKKRLDRLHRHWATLSAAAQRVLDRERDVLRQEAAQVEERYSRFHQVLDQIATREANLSERETAWEHEQAQAEVELAKLRLELRSVSAHRDLCERQLRERTEEAEQLARLLYEDGQPPALPWIQAA